MSDIDTSREAVEREIRYLPNWGQHTLRALLAERDGLRAELDKANATANENAMTAVRMGEENNRLRAENAALVELKWRMFNAMGVSKTALGSSIPEMRKAFDLLSEVIASMPEQP